jgi:hypothetical protein
MLSRLGLILLFLWNRHEKIEVSLVESESRVRKKKRSEPRIKCTVREHALAIPRVVARYSGKTGLTHSNMYIYIYVDICHKISKCMMICTVFEFFCNDEKNEKCALTSSPEKESPNPTSSCRLLAQESSHRLNVYRYEYVR